MKKFLASAAALIIATPAVVSAEGFNGFSAGATVGLNALQTQFSQSTTAGLNLKTNSSKNVFNGGLVAAYGKVFGQMYVGAEFSFGLGSGDVKASENSILNAKVKQQYSMRPAARIGFLAAPKTLLFASIGATGSKFKASSNQLNALATTGKFNKNLWGFSVGAGVQTFVAEKVSATFEYIYTSYSKKKFSAGTDTVKIQPRDNLFRVGVSYHF